jgi:hypothetical protein
MRIIALFVTLIISVTSMAQPISTKEWDRQSMMQSPNAEVEATQSIDNVDLVIAGTPHKAYLQWYAGTEQEYSLALKEFNLGADYEISIVDCDGCEVFTLSLTHVFEGFEKRVEVRVTGLGEYRVRFL